VTTLLVHFQDKAGEKVTFTMNVPDDQFEALELYARVNGLTLDEALTRAVNDLVATLPPIAGRVFEEGRGGKKPSKA
jgi:hypothetical protein